MASGSLVGGVVALLVLAATTAGCNTTQGRPTAAESTATSSRAATTPPSRTSTTRSSVAPTPTGQPIGMATMQVRGTGPATLRYQINGGAEQTETGVALPWEKQYPVYDQISTSVSADAGDAELICSIIMDGNLVAFESEPRPTCSFAYYG